jgi:aspartate carbamoyltransferase catalytic subunit
MITWNRKHLLDIESLSPAEIQLVHETARAFKAVGERAIKKVPALRGKTVINLFIEPSTRTRISFELAALRLTADVINFTAEASSLKKGETLKDTARNLEALNADIIIIRHSATGAPHFLSRFLRGSVVNAGDGAHEHPTQALLDAMTIRRHKGRITGLTVAMIGDITHSRVVRSNIHLLTRMGATVRVAGPRTMMPKGIERMGVEVHHHLESAIEGADVVTMLRLQLERQRRTLFPSTAEYARLFGLTAAKLELAKPDAIVMHPGPMNRGVEIASDVADGPRSVILEQVGQGVAVRMAVLYLLAGARERRT